MKKKQLYLFILIPSVFLGLSVFSNQVVAHEDQHAVISFPKNDWTFSGLFGTFKRDQLQRGFQVYKEVCSACHGLKRIAFRNFNSLGFSEAEIKSLAAQYIMQDGPNGEGKMFDRPGLPKDLLISPFPNDNAARAANNGALPPDLSLIVKARVGGPDYVYALLTGYVKPPTTVHLESGRHYNAYFPGNQLSMAQPLHDAQVIYADGTKATVEQMSKDVVSFLSWAAEPEMEERKQLGIKVFLYLLLTTGLFYATMRRIWARVK
ncbi:MAG: cytochrome c1 [Candidatus Paracaedibacteraceae bacterium]|nr:cytochrome c1 [Candidatus Paracaedibacteraceae bacterium]